MARDDEAVAVYIPIAEELRQGGPHGENVWSAPLGDDLYRVENVPAWAFDVSWGDVVRATRDADGILTFCERVRPSGNCTVRLLITGDGPFDAKMSEAIERFERLGVYGEAGGPLLALNIKPASQTQLVRDEIVRGFEEEVWVFQESDVNSTWLRLA